MSGIYRHNDFAFAGLILFVLAVPVLAFLLSNSTNKQDTTYAEKKCAEQQLRYADPETISDIEGVQFLPARERAKQTEDSPDGEPNWCDVAAQQSMANSARGSEQAAWVSALLTFFGVVLIFFTLFYTARTLDEARATTAVAQQALIAQERPWVSVNMRIGSNLVFDKGHGQITIDFLLKNFGNSPALEVEIEFKIITVLTNAWDVMKEISRIAKNRSKQRGEKIGHRIFPDQDEFVYSIGKPITQKEVYEAYKDIGIDEIKMFTAFIVGCAVYKSAFSDENHITEFFVMMGKADPNNPKNFMALSTEDGVTPADQLSLRLLMGSGAVD